MVRRHSCRSLVVEGPKVPFHHENRLSMRYFMQDRTLAGGAFLPVYCVTVRAKAVFFAEPCAGLPVTVTV